MQDLIKLAQSGDQKAIAQVFEANAGVITAIMHEMQDRGSYRRFEIVIPAFSCLLNHRGGRVNALQLLGEPFSGWFAVQW